MEILWQSLLRLHFDSHSLGLEVLEEGVDDALGLKVVKEERGSSQWLFRGKFLYNISNVRLDLDTFP